MANVPTYGPRKQTLNPVFTGKLESRATPNAFGAQIGRGMQQLANGIAQAGDAFAAVQEMEDKAIVDQKVNEYSDYARKRTYDPETGYLTTQGENAVTGREGYEKDLETQRDEIGKDLSPRQQRLYNDATDARRRQALDTSIKHAAGQRKKWFDDASTARLSTFADDALAMSDEPEKLELNLAAARAEIDDKAATQGWSPEQTAVAQEEFLSGVHKNIVLKNAIADPLKAKEWLDANRDKMTQAHQFDLDKALDAPVLNATANREAERIMQDAERPPRAKGRGLAALVKDDTVDMDNVRPETKDAFGRLQQALGTQLVINDGFRSPKANAKAGGATYSQHMHGTALDISVAGMSKAQRLKIIDEAFNAGFTGIGVGKNIIHIDQGSPRSWGYVTAAGGGPVPEYAADLIKRRIAEVKSGKPRTTQSAQQPKKAKPVEWDGKDLKTGIQTAAEAIGIDPVVLATVISYETGGTFNPTAKGPVTQWGQHMGLIQFGGPQAKQHGVNWKDPIGSQLGPDGAIVSYMKHAGVKPGMGLMDVYSAVNAGAPGLENRTDANNGGAPGTVKDKVMYQMDGHHTKAMDLMGATGAEVPGYVGPQYIADQVAGIADPRVRAATAAAIAKKYAAQDAAERRAERQNKIAVEKFIIQNPGTDPTSLPVEMQLQLGIDGMNTLWSYNEKLAAQGAIETDEVLYAELQRLQAEDPLAFAEDVDLFDYVDRLSTKDRREFQKLQVGAIKDKREGSEKALTDAKSVSTAMSIADTRLEAAGIKKTGKAANEETAQREARFQKALVERMREFQVQNERVPNDYEVSEMVDQLLLPIVLKSPGMLWGENEEEGSFVFDAPFRADNETAEIAVPYDQIPVDVRLAIRQELAKELGRDPTEDEVKADYVEFVLTGG
jgi:uncharacterized protein YcbK (DUF882 family)